MPLYQIASELVSRRLARDRGMADRVPRQAYRGHEWYPLDCAYSVLRRTLVDDDAWRFGPPAVRARARLMFDKTASRKPIGNAVFCDIGGGEFNPYSPSAVMYLNGAASTLTVDIQPLNDSRRTAEALYDLLVDCLAHPEHWHWSAGDRVEFLARIRRFDLDALRGGELEAGLCEVPVRRMECDIIADGLPRNTFTHMTSWAVLEHFLDFPAACRCLFEAMAAGGVAFHTVDLADHRALVDPDRYHHWSFLCEAEGWSDGLTNRLRASQIRACLEQAGFEVLEQENHRAPLPDGLRDTLAEPYASMADDELQTVAMELVLRKPGE